MVFISEYPKSDGSTYYINMESYNFKAETSKGDSGFSISDMILATKLYFGEDISLDKVRISCGEILTRRVKRGSVFSEDWEKYIVMTKVSH